MLIFYYVWSGLLGIWVGGQLRCYSSNSLSVKLNARLLWNTYFADYCYIRFQFPPRSNNVKFVPSIGGLGGAHSQVSSCERFSVFEFTRTLFFFLHWFSIEAQLNWDLIESASSWCTEIAMVSVTGTWIGCFAIRLCLNLELVLCYNLACIKHLSNYRS